MNKKSQPHTDKNAVKMKKAQKSQEKAQDNPQPEKEYGGYEAAGLPEPTRYKDWEVKGRCSDF